MFLRTIVVIVMLILFSAPLLSGAEIDLSRYDHISEEDIRIASVGVDYYGIGEFEKAAEYFERAVELAVKRGASPLYIDDLKIKLGTTLIALERFDEGQAVLKEVYEKDTAGASKKSGAGNEN